jgi:hypothetical protein
MKSAPRDFVNTSSDTSRLKSGQGSNNEQVYLDNLFGAVMNDKSHEFWIHAEHAYTEVPPEEIRQEYYHLIDYSVYEKYKNDMAELYREVDRDRNDTKSELNRLKAALKELLDDKDAEPAMRLWAQELLK